MSLLTISNLFPRPDKPVLGIFNLQLFEQFARETALSNVCLVPCWKMWKYDAIRRWKAPGPFSFATRYVPTPYCPGIGRNWNWRLYAHALRREIGEREKPEAVYSSWLYPDAVAAAQLAGQWQVPHWIMVLGSDAFHLRTPARAQVIRAACRTAAGIIVVSHELAATLGAAGIDAARIHVVPNGVNPGLFRHRDRTTAEFQLRQSIEASGAAGTDLPAVWSRPARRILYAGNFVPVKGPDVVWNAFAELARSDGDSTADLQLVMIGDGPLRSKIMRQTRRDARLRGRVVFPGNRSHSELALWMNACDCLCLGSRSEGMPNIVIEALASGLPVVATDVGACRSMLADEPAARIVSPDNALEMARALLSLMSEPVARQELAARHGRYTWSDQARRILDLMGMALPADSRGGT